MKIILDAGHGTNTAGKRTPDGSMKEFEFNSVVANYVRDELLNCEDTQVDFVHDPTGKVDIALLARTNSANSKKGDVLVSIHANAFQSTWNDANGIETYIHPTNHTAVSKKIADIVQKKLIASTGLRNRGVKTANFHMIREVDMPSILIECGFMTNKNEAELLKSDAYRKKCAQAISSALIEFYNLRPKKAVEPVKSGLYRVQVGAFSIKANADKLAAELKSKGYPVIVVQ